MARVYLAFGLFIAGLVVLLRLLEQWRYGGQLGMAWYVALIALLFLGLGLYLGRPRQQKSHKLAAPPPAPDLSLPPLAGQELLTTREYEVLVCLQMGLSNQEIADRLFVSLSTVKTHISNIYSKLGASRRTQALAKAQALGLIGTAIGQKAESLQNHPSG